jgi:anaerobic magnesium-protoporphyrin IX monomethyl ester cyclase
MKILLATLHAKYVHNSLALPCIAASCKEVEGTATVIREFTVNEQRDRVLAAVVETDPDVAAFSCYIWNIEETLRLVSDLKRVRPETYVILGGPEVSYGSFELMTRNPAIDCVVRGEGEETFRESIALLNASFPDTSSASLLAAVPGLALRMGEEIFSTCERAPIADLDTIPSPFKAGFADLKKPLVYYESSRGCPFSCAFCLSSLDRGVRSFSMERIREDLGILMAAGVGTVKFVDRTFNYDASRSNEIWDFILSGNRSSRFHFEIAADLLTEENFRVLKRAPSDMFRFEIGVQSGEEDALHMVGRKSDLKRLAYNVRRLKAETAVTIHLDLVAGLPGEDSPGYLRSLQLLFDLLGPDGVGGHIQVEILKVLKGSPMRRIADEQGYAYSAFPPYRVLRTPWLSYQEICRMDAISRLLDLFFNSGRFRTALFQIAAGHPLSDFFYEASRHWKDEALPTSMSQTDLFDALWRFSTGYLGVAELEEFRDALCFDFCMIEYPSSGKFPSFFEGDGKAGKTREIIEGLTDKLDIPAGSRVRSFSRMFQRDYRSHPWGEGRVELLFVYVSAAGKGQRVEVMNI